VQPEGRNDPSIVLVFALVVARSFYKPPKNQQKAMSSPQIYNSLKTKQINPTKFAYELSPIRYN
jgi:hypothetical protein